MPTKLLRRARKIYTCDDRDRTFEDGWMYLENGRIADLGTEPCPVAGADEEIDVDGCILTPGLINLHHHFFQSLCRATPVAEKGSVLAWLLKLYPVWVELDADSLYWATKVAAAELLLGGGTTSVDHSYMVPGGDPEILESEIAAAREIGLRLNLVVGSAPTLEGDLERSLAPVMGARLDRLIYPEETIYALLRDTARRHHDASDGAMLQIAFGPTGVTYTEPEVTATFAAIARDHGCGLHTHLHPRPDEREKARKHLGCGPVDFLGQAGWLRPGTWFAHASQLTDDEMSMLADGGAGIAHCARMLPRLGFPVTRISEMRRRGLPVGVGTDGSGSNDSGSILNDLRLALVLHRLGTPPDADIAADWLSPYDALVMATRTAAGILNRTDIGTLAPGKAADIAGFRLDRVGTAGCYGDPLSALLMAGSDPYADLTMVGGEIVVRHGRLCTDDEDEIVAAANAAAEAMIARSGMPAG